MEGKLREGGNEINGGSDVGEDKRGGHRGRCRDGVVIDQGIQRWMWKKREREQSSERRDNAEGLDGWMVKDGGREGWIAGCL